MATARGAQGPRLNRAGVPMLLGRRAPGYDGSKTYYCGRKLDEMKDRPGCKDGRCGPIAGPQCSDCKSARTPKLLLNRAGAPMTLGVKLPGQDGSQTFYCGRRLPEMQDKPGSDGR